MSAGDAPDPENDKEEEAEDAGLKTREDIRRADMDAQIYQHILRREQRRDSPLTEEDVWAIDVPLDRLLNAAVLFQDIAVSARIEDDAPRPAGLNFLADAMHREVVRLYRLFHGYPPDDM